MSSTIWTREATALPCPRCHASAGARCRVYDGRPARYPHEGRLVPSVTCPRCGYVDTDPTNVAGGYCARCRDWTSGGSLRAGQDVLL